MKTRTAAIAAGLLLGVASPARANVAHCPLTTTNFNFFAPCRIGHFTISDWLYDDSFVPGNPPPFSSIVFQLFDDHLDMTVVGSGLFAYDNTGTSQTFTELRFAFGVAADNPSTRFFASAVRYGGGGAFHLSAGAGGALSIGSKFGLGDPAFGGYQAGSACLFSSGLGFCQLGNSGQQVGPDFFGSTVLSTAWATSISGGPGSAILGNQTWTASLYFVAPSVVPEPETWGLMLTGLALVGFAAWRRRARA